jgi:general secretion pathway protein D
MKKSSTAPKNLSLGLKLACLLLFVFFAMGTGRIAEAVRVSEQEVPEKTPSKPARTNNGSNDAAVVRQSPPIARQPAPVQQPITQPPAQTAPEVPAGEPPPADARSAMPVRPPDKTPEKKEPPKRSVTIDFDNVDILLFVKFISEVTGKNFIIDNRVKGKVTIISPTKISVDEAYRVFESVLEVHGFTTVDSGDVIKIVPSTEARGKSIETRLREEAGIPEDKVITQLIRLSYANPDELKKLFAPLISKSSVMVSYPPSGMLIVTDVESNIQRLLRIISAIDVVGIGEEVSLIPLEHATAAVIAKTLTTLFQTAGAPARIRAAAVAAATPAVKIVADDRMNALIVSASEHDTLKIKELIQMLDQETPRGTGDIRVHYLQYADAEELAKVLTSLPTKDATGAQAKGAAPVISKEVQIVSDKATNSLVITANKQDYLALTDVIDKLDIPRPMVYIEALIMEVKADKDFRIGVEWRIGDDDIGTYQGNTVGGFAASRPTGLLPDPTSATLTPLDGFSLGVLGEAITIGGIQFPSIGAVARAFQSDTDVHILQTPQILTADNEEAEIQIVDNIPYLTKEASGDQNYQTYEYKDVGVKLKLTPQINRERYVRLKVFQEYSTVAEAGERPTTLKRTADTTVVVKDTHTLVIGGLISDQISGGTAGVPCLSDIPGMGWLFKSFQQARNKTNLFIFITPHVLESPEEADRLSKERREGITQMQGGAIKLYDRPVLGPTLKIEPEPTDAVEEWLPDMERDETNGGDRNEEPPDMTTEEPNAAEEGPLD